VEKIIERLVSDGKLRAEAIEEAREVEKIHDRVREGALPTDEYERFVLAMMRIDVYLENSYNQRY
jgi:hypothetical protein